MACWYVARHSTMNSETKKKMNWDQKLDIVHGHTRHSPEVITKISEVLANEGVVGTFYIGYPVMASADSTLTVDALLVSPQTGLVVFHLIEADQDYAAIQDRLHYVIEANLGRHESLRRGRSLGVPINVITLYPPHDQPPAAKDDYLWATHETLAAALTRTKKVPDETLFRGLSAAIQRVTTIKPTKKRANVLKENSKGAILKSIERNIANLDRWQRSAAIETPEGLQRIRGLAGSGKTVVLALKAAYLHTQHPDWSIAVTFHTRSLYQQFRDLIERFTFEHMNDKPDWTKLQVLHSWGSSWHAGLYSRACDAINMQPVNLQVARNRYGSQRAFAGICDELAAALHGRNVETFDAVLIDEAQDMPPAFFRIVDSLTKNPKRIIYAYDELQNLSETTVATPTELLQREVTLVNAANAPRQDIILPVCYRNTPWALTLAHAVGFGLFREQGIVQHFDDPAMWEDIGYQVQEGTLTAAADVTIERAAQSYPGFFKDLLTPDDAVRHEWFGTKEAQYKTIAQQIRGDIDEGELEPDDIMIILPDSISQKKDFFELRQHLDSYKIDSNLAGITNDVDEFTQPGSVTVSGIFRAKGNEAPMVYIANADYCAAGYDLIRLRNVLFTAITRSRAWVRVFGVGERMVLLQSELDKVTTSQYKLQFKVPTTDDLAKVRRINRDRTATEKTQIRKAEQSLGDVLRLLKEGVLPEDLPQLQELQRELKLREQNQ